MYLRPWTLSASLPKLYVSIKVCSRSNTQNGQLPVLFLRPPYGGCEIPTVAIRPPQLFYLLKFEIRHTAAAANVSATVWGRRKSAADAGISQFTFCGGRTAVVADVSVALLLMTDMCTKRKGRFYLFFSCCPAGLRFTVRYIDLLWIKRLVILFVPGYTAG